MFRVCCARRLCDGVNRAAMLALASRPPRRRYFADLGANLFLIPRAVACHACVGLMCQPCPLAQLAVQLQCVANLLVERLATGLAVLSTSGGLSEGAQD